MDNKTKNRLIYKIREIFLTSSLRSNAYKPYRVAPSTFKCNSCKGHFYTGAKNMEKLKEEGLLDTFPDLRKVAKNYVHLDHIEPVIDTKTGWKDWNTFIESLFCSEDNLQVLCKPCHDKKTKKENKNRKNT